MSVAFRRDSDEEHLEPRFELPIPPGPNLVTPRGQQLINERVTELESEIAQLEDATALERAKRDLRYWQTRQVTMELAPAADGLTVQIGTRARFLFRGRERLLAIVGHDEADPAKGLLAYSAPLSRALLGCSPGDVIEFDGDPDAIELLAIEVA
jgi:transcription elongation GreA/GreB family factor